MWPVSAAASGARRQGWLAATRKRQARFEYSRAQRQGTNVSNKAEDAEGSAASTNAEPQQEQTKGRSTLPPGSTTLHGKTHLLFVVNGPADRGRHGEQHQHDDDRHDHAGAVPAAPTFVALVAAAAARTRAHAPRGGGSAGR